MSTELAEPKYTLEQWLGSDKFKRALANIVGSEESVTRFCQIALSTAKRNSKLLECHQASVLDCLIRLSQVKLDADGYHAHLVPFWNNKAKPPRLEAQLILDYKGLVTIVRRNPKISIVKGNVVYKKDGFIYREGSARVFSHEPTYQPPGEDNPIIGAYSYVQFANGDWEPDYLPIWKIELARARSRARDEGPWKTDYDEMCIKTALRHHTKTLPLAVEERQAVTLDDDQYETFNPFVGKLEHTKPQFLNERTISPIDLGARDPLVPSREESEPAKPERTVTPTRRRSGSARTQDRVNQEPSIPAPGGDSESHKYGPNDSALDGGASGESAPTTGEGGLSDEGGTKQVISKGLQKLLDAIQKEGVSQRAVIEVLVENELDLGRAKESGFVADLPESTLRLAVLHWPSIVFSIKRAETPADGGSTPSE